MLASNLGTSRIVRGNGSYDRLTGRKNLDKLTQSTDNRYYYGLRTRRSDETLREDQRCDRLLRASAEGQLPRIRHLLRLGTDIDFCDENEFTALHHAVLSGFEDCVRELIDGGSDVNAMTRYGVALNLAAQKERSNVISILLGARADRTRAVVFAAEHRESLAGLSPLFDDLVTGAAVEVAAALSPGDRDAVEGDQTLISTAIDGKLEELESNAKASEDNNHYSARIQPNQSRAEDSFEADLKRALEMSLEDSKGSSGAGCAPRPSVPQQSKPKPQHSQHSTKESDKIVNHELHLPNWKNYDSVRPRNYSDIFWKEVMEQNTKKSTALESIGYVSKILFAR